MDHPWENAEAYGPSSNINQEAYDKSRDQLMVIFCNGNVDGLHGPMQDEPENGIGGGEEVFRVLDYEHEVRKPSEEDSDEILKPPPFCNDSNASGANNHQAEQTYVSGHNAPVAAVNPPELPSSTESPPMNRRVSVQSLLISSPYVYSPQRSGRSQGILPDGDILRAPPAPSRVGSISSPYFQNYTWPSQFSRSTSRPTSKLKDSISIDASESVLVGDDSRPSSRPIQGYVHHVQAHNVSSFWHEPTLIHQRPYFSSGYLYPDSHKMKQSSYEEYQETIVSPHLLNHHILHQSSPQPFDKFPLIKGTISAQRSNHHLIDFEGQASRENRYSTGMEEEHSPQEQRHAKVRYRSLHESRMEQSMTISIHNPRIDDTVPLTDDDDRSYVAMMMVAMYCTSHAEDNESMLQTWQNSCHDRGRVEKAAWEVLVSLTDAISASSRKDANILISGLLQKAT